MKHSASLLGAVAAASLLAASPVMAEKLTIGLSSEPTAMDPHFHNLGPNNAVARHIYDNLINQDEKQRLTPGLAVSWAPIDELTWEFKLRQGVTFHDGSAFNADDVVCTFERAPNVPNSPSSFGTYTKGKTVHKVDDYTVHFKSETPYPLMANDISTIAIVSDSVGCDASTEDYNNGTASVGTGPFKFASYKPGEAIAMTRNEGYWGEKPAWTKETNAINFLGIF